MTQGNSSTSVTPQSSAVDTGYDSFSGGKPPQSAYNPWPETHGAGSAYSVSSDAGLWGKRVGMSGSFTPNPSMMAARTTGNTQFGMPPPVSSRIGQTFGASGPPPFGAPGYWILFEMSNIVSRLQTTMPPAASDTTFRTRNKF